MADYLNSVVLNVNGGSNEVSSTYANLVSVGRTASHQVHAMVNTNTNGGIATPTSYGGCGINVKSELDSYSPASATLIEMENNKSPTSSYHHHAYLSHAMNGHGQHPHFHSQFAFDPSNNGGPSSQPLSHSEEEELSQQSLSSSVLSPAEEDGPHPIHLIPSDTPNESVTPTATIKGKKGGGRGRGCGVRKGRKRKNQNPMESSDDGGEPATKRHKLRRKASVSYDDLQNQVNTFSILSLNW